MLVGGGPLEAVLFVVFDLNWVLLLQGIPLGWGREVSLFGSEDTLGLCELIESRILGLDVVYTISDPPESVHVIEKQSIELVMQRLVHHPLSKIILYVAVYLVDIGIFH